MADTKIVIGDLPQLARPSSTDKIPVQHGNATYKINYKDLQGPQGDDYVLTAADKAEIAGMVNKTSIGLGNVDNTSDENKPVSIAQAAALELKLDKANVYNGIDKAEAGYALDAVNTLDEPDRIKTVSSGANLAENQMSYSFPPHSVTVMVFS